VTYLEGKDFERLPEGCQVRGLRLWVGKRVSDGDCMGEKAVLKIICFGGEYRDTTDCTSNIIMFF
jgi:hypothetical protein